MVDDHAAIRDRNEEYANGNGLTIAYAEALGVPVDASHEPWRDLISEIRLLRVDS
ncbi:hypothetical protein [Streptomyces sp. NPDC001903]|uniref:hypothetical protein n=1 Tax=Streptomyces sp. NPDC001903 TaxID=3364622 RepID=UPI0036C1A806